MSKHPVILSIGYVVVLSIFASIVTIIAAVLELTPIQTMLFQTVMFLLSCTLAIFIMHRSEHSLKEYGIQHFRDINLSRILYFIPLVMVETMILFVGFNKDITLSNIIVVLIVMLVVSINEEVYFRGLILKTLSVKGNSFAIIISAILFGMSHIGGIVVGKGIELTLLLIVYSALFAFICAEIVIITKSILIPIIWHFTHNFISSITVETSYGITFIIVGIQCAILLSYSIYLWSYMWVEECSD